MKLDALDLKPSKLLKLQQAHFWTLEDVLLRFPIRYEDIQMVPFSAWKKGDKIWVEGEVLEPVLHRRIRKNMTLTTFLLQTQEASFQVNIFNRPWIKASSRITLNARYDGQNKLTALNYNARALSTQTGLQPIYSSSIKLTAKEHKDLLDMALANVSKLDLIDVPDDFRHEYKLVPYAQAITWMHKAPSMDHVKMALRTLKYEEFLRFQTKLQLNRLENFGLDLGKVKVFDRRVIQAWTKELPFTLSPEQGDVLKTILDDLQSSRRMYRLLQGDVGSGKTVIAAMAMYANVLAHYQCAFLVPTEILAFQHASTLKTYLPKSLRIEVLSASITGKPRAALLAALKAGEIDILIGTHALIQAEVEFKNAGLVVADEQHRFGVDQRRQLSEKGDKVDFLLMSATPIPRTLASVVFGDLDVSSITQYHASKMPVATTLVEGNSLKPILKELLARIAQGDQAYVVCSAIMDSDEREVKTVESIYDALSKALPDSVHVAMMHGKMKAAQRDQVMQDFIAQKTQVLISTTVIEVGVNVPTANLIIIYDADRFGLSQLHQLRGRVGRGTREGQCYLLTNSADELSLTRLRTLVELSDGFEIANKDLELRGPGELFGLKQSGVPGFLVANVVLDQAILMVAQKDAQTVMQKRESDSMKPWILKCKTELSTESLD